MPPLAAVGLLAAAPGLAQSDRPRTVGGWTVAESKDGKGCFVTRDYDHRGATTLLLGLDSDGANRLVVLNANWSIKPNDRLKLDFRLSNSSYPAHFAVGMASDGKQGFVTSFGAKFPSYFAGSKTLYITRGTVPVERLDLAGAAAAVGALQKCIAELRGADEPSRIDGKTGNAAIPKDPFAPAPKQRRDK